jgi:hypothetical protein
MLGWRWRGRRVRGLITQVENPSRVLLVSLGAAAIFNVFTFGVGELDCVLAISGKSVGWTPGDGVAVGVLLALNAVSVLLTWRERPWKLSPTTPHVGAAPPQLEA